MNEMTPQPDPAAVSDAVLQALAKRTTITRFTTSSGGLSLPQAYKVTSLYRRAAEARGERVVGRKIGFTNTEMWAAYGVRAPIWGYCTDRTTRPLADAPPQRVSDFVEPRLEPEIILGLKSAPSPGMDEAALLDCVSWISLGYEVVQSIYANWTFAAADTVVANALHGALLIGRRHPVAPRRDAWLSELATFQAQLSCDGVLRESGGGSLVMGSPLTALRHLVALLAGDPVNPPLAEGEIISTGTLTLAASVAAGETWRTEVSGVPLDPISMRFVA